MPILADLHNHSCLSPCGSLEMSPRLITSLARARGVSLLALTDHNSSLNCPAFAAACKAEGILPLFGMEATVMEELHVLCLFGSLDAALAFSAEWYNLLPLIPNDPSRLGDQVYVDEEENIIGEVEKYLGVAAEVYLDDLGPRVASYGGIVIPAHVDRPAFSMTSQLGFVVDGPWAALECVRLPSSVDTRGYPLTTSSDAHYPEHVGRRPFELDIDIGTLVPGAIPSGNSVDMRVLTEALNKRPRA
ncbi:MAG: PHP domain-containing protein [Treponemataceae bacterium]